MTDQGPDAAAPAPEPRIKPGRRISAVWIIPLIAVLVGGGLFYRVLSQKGPDVTVTFDTAEGLEAGKTPVKYKEVVVGTVAEVTLDPDSRKVAVVAKMTKTAEPLLTEETRFWVVRPQVGVSGISGLGTLVSGAYIEFDPGRGAASGKRDFVGLEEPPVVRTDTPGLEIELVTDNLGSLNRGSPIYFRGIEAGEVLRFGLTPNTDQVVVKAFVRAPHDKLVRRTTRFWNVSGLQVSLDSRGVTVKSATLASLVRGGIAFETPSRLDSGAAVEPGTRFVLYDDREQVLEPTYTETAQFILYFESSVRGLNVGAPVEFRGIRIGSVTDIRLEFDPREIAAYIPVLVELELDRVSLLARDRVGEQLPVAERQTNLDQVIARGLRARLKTGNFLTGQLIVDLEMLPDAPLKLARRDDAHPEIPTLPPQLEEISNSVTELVEKLQALPLDTISEKIVSTLDGAERLVHSEDIRVAIGSLKGASQKLDRLLATVDGTIVPQASGSLQEAEQALASLNRMVADNSAFRYETQEAIREIAAAARSIRQLAEYLQRNPNALLTGKSPN